MPKLLDKIRKLLMELKHDSYIHDEMEGYLDEINEIIHQIDNFKEQQFNAHSARRWGMEVEEIKKMMSEGIAQAHKEGFESGVNVGIKTAIECLQAVLDSRKDAPCIQQVGYLRKKTIT